MFDHPVAGAADFTGAACRHGFECPGLDLGRLLLGGLDGGGRLVQAVAVAQDEFEVQSFVFEVPLLRATHS